VVEFAAGIVAMRPGRPHFFDRQQERISCDEPFVQPLALLLG